MQIFFCSSEKLLGGAGGGGLHTPLSIVKMYFPIPWSAEESTHVGRNVVDGDDGHAEYVPDHPVLQRSQDQRGLQGQGSSYKDPDLFWLQDPDYNEI